MKCLILAAGYATRLYPLTENFPKPLLKVGSKTILDWLIDDIDSTNQVDEYVVISNHRYIDSFITWAKDKPYKVTVLDDGSISNETRLGAVKDVQFAIEELKLDSDMLVIAGDNVLDFSFKQFIDYALSKKTTCVMRYFEPMLEKIKKSSALEINSSDLIKNMVEKPAEPASHWCCPPFYYYTRADSFKVKEGIEEGCGTDAPGSFIAWLSKVSPVHAFQMPGKRYDIGNIESYELVQREYKGVVIF